MAEYTSFRVGVDPNVEGGNILTVGTNNTTKLSINGIEQELPSNFSSKSI